MTESWTTLKILNMQHSDDKHERKEKKNEKERKRIEINTLHKSWRHSRPSKYIKTNYSAKEEVNNTRRENEINNNDKNNDDDMIIIANNKNIYIYIK